MGKWNFKMVLQKIILALATCTFLASCAYNGLFFPLDTREPNKLDVAVEYHQLDSFDSTPLGISVIKTKGEAKAVLFVLHGSGSTVNNWVHVVQNMADYGYEVVMMEYRGFAGSEGKAGHVSVVKDAEKVLGWLNSQYDRKVKPLLVMGQSYGGQIAISIVNQKPDLADGLITEGAFTSFKDIALNSTPTFVRPFTWITFSEPYNGKERLAQVAMPKLIIHSKDDTVVPFSMGQSLYQSAQQPKQFMEVSDGHITATKEHAEKLDKRISALFL